MRSFVCAAVVAAAVLVSTSVQSDDSTAALGLGGVVFTKTGTIRMAAEDLRISPKRVDVRFTFVNDGPNDVDTVVAFPLPDIDTLQYWNEPLGTVTDDPVNFVGFKLTIDGRPVAFTSEQRAYYKGKDVSATIKAAGLPLNIVMGNFDRLDKLSPANKKILLNAGLVDIDGDNIMPKWLLRTRFHWNQHFPAGKTVIVEHSYQPVTGGTFYTTYDLKPDSSGRTWKKDYCMDPPTMSRVVKMLNAAAKKTGNDGSDGTLQIWSTDYVLSTAKNWKGGIGKFHLTLDKMAPGNTLSLCWDGELRKTSATTFEFSAENYVPTRDVKMVVLE